MSGKRYLQTNVYDAAVERMRITFDNFDKVCVSFSGGKDSSVTMHLAHQVAQEKQKKFYVLFIDLEGQYKVTIQHIEEMMSLSTIKQFFWVCLPLNLRNAVSSFEPFWCCWEPESKEYWVRDLPTYDCVIADQLYFPFYWYRMEFEHFTPRFAHWLADGKSFASVVAIRADESLNRYRSIVRENKRRFEGYGWTTQVDDPDNNDAEGIYNVYPIYDWKVQDIWTYVGKHSIAYNRLYDYMYLSGMSLSEMRICQPYGDDQRRGLDCFHKIEPDTWFRIVQRVSGANYGAKYARQKFLGYHRGLGLPDGQTWESYAKLLLSTMPPVARDHYVKKINVFLKWWANYCGEDTRLHTVMPEDEFDELGLYCSGLIPYSGYEGTEVPDVKEWRDPLWKRIAMCLLKNDFLCKMLGFSQTKYQAKQYAELKERYADI